MAPADIKTNQEEYAEVFVERRVRDVDMGENFVERRVEAMDRERRFVERRINELDRRRDTSLAEKLQAMEKLFNMLVLTKADAMSIAISRIQGESKDCIGRCSRQVKLFYDEIRDLREKGIQRDLNITVISQHFAEYEEAQEEEVQELKKRHEKEVEDLKKEVTALKEWKTSFWTVHIPALIAILLATIGSAYAGASWILEYIKKMHEG